MKAVEGVPSTDIEGIEETHSKSVANHLLKAGYVYLHTGVVHKRHHVIPIVRAIVYVLGRPRGVEHIEITKALMAELHPKKESEE